MQNAIGADRRRARHKARYGAESRFRFLGFAAVMVSVLFLVLLLSTIVGQGIPAFTYNYVKLPVNMADIDPSQPASGDYDSVVRDGIAELMPYLSDRRGKRLARSMISGGSGVELREAAISDPEMLKEKTAEVPVSDFVDLYLKGLVAKPELSQPDTLIDVSGTTGEVTVEVGAGVFSKFLADSKAEIGKQANAKLEAMNAIQRSLDHQLSIKTNATDSAVVEEARKQAEVLESQLAGERELFDALIARRDSTNTTEKLDASMPSLLLRVNNGVVKVSEIDSNTAKGEVLVPLEKSDAAAGEWTMQVIPTPESNRKFSDREVAVADRMVAENLVESHWAEIFFTKGASREPELAGIWGAVVGSFFTMIITLMLSFPLGVAAAVYLEEFAPKNWITNIIEVNINNLAAVPSIVFGLLGLAVFLNFFELPRSAPLVGGMVLALMTLPTIIIASRAALKAVPPSIREAALGVGASNLQAVFHHVLPLAMPGILTGTIVGMAQALGETAPLLMIGMVAFVVDIPGGITDPATVLPVQIYMWADFPEPGFQQKTAAAIMVLLVFLVIMNAIAVFLRQQFERRW